MEKMSVVTPEQVERRLKELSKLIDEAHDQLVTAEKDFHISKAEYEIALAESRIKFASVSSPTGKNYTVGEREDMAILEHQNKHRMVAVNEAVVKANRANVARYRVQVDIARSIGTSVRTGMDVA